MTKTNKRGRVFDRMKLLVGGLQTLKLRTTKFSDGTSVFLDGQMFVGGTKRLFTIPKD